MDISNKYVRAQHGSAKKLERRTAPKHGVYGDGTLSLSSHTCHLVFFPARAMPTRLSWSSWKRATAACRATHALRLALCPASHASRTHPLLKAQHTSLSHV